MEENQKFMLSSRCKLPAKYRCLKGNINNRGGNEKKKKKHLGRKFCEVSLCKVTNANQTCSDHFAMYTDVKPLIHTHDTKNIMSIIPQ